MACKTSEWRQRRAAVQESTPEEPGSGAGGCGPGGSLMCGEDKLGVGPERKEGNIENIYFSGKSCFPD